MVRSAFARCVCIASCLLLIFLSLSTAQAQSTGKILAHTYLGSFPNGAETLVSIDPGTGTVTPLGSGVPNSGSISLPFVPLSALDLAGHRYFFPDTSFVLHELDMQTGGQLAAVPLSPIQPMLAALKFDSSSGKLFGHASVAGAETLLSIDPVTGTVTAVGAVPNSALLSVQPAIAALDPANHKYFFVDSTPILYVFNTQTGAPIAVLPLSTALFPAMPAAMEFDPSSGKLYCHGYVGSFPNGAETLVAINPATGGVTLVGAWPNSGSLFDQLGMAAFDSAGSTYYFVDSNSILQQMKINAQAGVAGAGTPLSVRIFPSGMEFAPNLSAPPPPPPDPYVAQVQPPINPDGSSTFSTSRGSVPVKFTLTHNGVATCNLPAATISMLRTAGATTGTVDPGNGTSFRISDCQYVYNLGTSGLGAGTYEADVTIAGKVVGKGTFTLGR